MFTVVFTSSLQALLCDNARVKIVCKLKGKVAHKNKSVKGARQKPADLVLVAQLLLWSFKIEIYFSGFC